MGLQKETGRKNFLSISNGKLVLQHQNPIEGVTVERENKNGKVVHEEFFSSIEAYITSIQSKDTTFGKVWEIELKDGDESYILSFNYSSRYANNFFRALPHVNLDAQVKIAPWAMKDKKDASKTVIGLSLYQFGDKVPFMYTREQPGDMPEMKKVKRKGKEEWDDSDQLEFFEKMVKDIFGERKQAVVETASDNEEEAPF